MKKTVIITLTTMLLLWLAVLCTAVVRTSSTTVIGGADWATFQSRLTECLRSPFGWAVQLITAAEIVFLGALVIKGRFKKNKDK